MGLKKNTNSGVLHKLYCICVVEVVRVAEIIEVS